MKAMLIYFLLLSPLVHKEKWDENQTDWTPLMLAIYENDTKKFTSLIDNQADVTYRIKTSFKLDAMDVAILKNNHIAVHKLVLTNKFKNVQEYFENACGQENVRNVEIFIKHGVNINKASSNGHIPLMTACSFGSTEIVECLLKNNVKINHQREVDGITPLMLAAFNGEVDKVKLLLKYGAKKRMKDKNGERAYNYVDQIYPYKKISAETKIVLKSLLKVEE